MNTKKLSKAGQLAVLSLVLGSALWLAGCSEQNASEPERRAAPATVSKVIALKSERVEQRLGFDFFDKQSIRTRAKTIYYLVAEDGTGVEVKLSEFAKAKVGDPWAALGWRNVD